MSNSGTLQAFFQLRGSDRIIALKTAAGLLLTKVGLHLFGFTSWKSWVVRFSGKKSSLSPLSMPSVQQLAILSVATARRLFVRTNCLEQSLVIWSLLRRRGVPVDLRFGGRKVGMQFEAHAWVEWQGIVLNDDGVYREFTPFEPLEEPPAALEKYTR